MTATPFISYAREDHAVAIQLRNDLVRLGATPWMDVADLVAGEDWKLAISSALRRSSHIIVLVSRNSVTKQGYVQKEVREALELLDRLPPGTVFLIPVRLDDTEPLHPRLRDLHWVDLFKSYDAALNGIARSLGLDASSKTNERKTSDATARRVLVEFAVGELVERGVGRTPKFVFKVVNAHTRPITISGAGIEVPSANISVPAFKPETLSYPPRLALSCELADGQRLDFMESVDFFKATLSERGVRPPVEVIGYVTDAFGERHESKRTIYEQQRTAG